MEFADLSTRAQVGRLRRVAIVALTRYPIDVARLRLIEHGFNTTFRVDTTTGEKYALRIDVSRRKPEAALDAEMAWLSALSADTELVVPTPLATVDGDLHTAVEFPELAETLRVAVLSWLPGRDLDVPTAPAVHEMGRITALLHEHAASWTIPAGAEFPLVDALMMDSPDRLRTEQPIVSDEQRRVLTEAIEHVEPLFDRMVRAGTPMPIHADLHQWNVKWMRAKMSVFDFDDAGIGVPAQDVAITTYYLPPDEEVRGALLDGYRTVAPLPPFTDEQFQAALAGRNLLLLNDLIAIENRSLREMATRYLADSVIRLRAYLESGVFRSDVPGVSKRD